jgi:retinol dehydrogenase 12
MARSVGRPSQGALSLSNNIKGHQLVKLWPCLIVSLHFCRSTPRPDPNSRTMSLSLLLWSAYERLWTLPTSTKDLSGRTIIITGANTGVGFESAKYFYAMNPARLILAVRSISKGQEAKETILSSITKSAPPGQDRGETNVEVWELDLASFDSVKRFSEKCLRDLGRLDILLENARVIASEWTTTVDGWESS